MLVQSEIRGALILGPAQPSSDTMCIFVEVHKSVIAHITAGISIWLRVKRSGSKKQTQLL